MKVKEPPFTSNPDVRFHELDEEAHCYGCGKEKLDFYMIPSKFVSEIFPHPVSYGFCSDCAGRIATAAGDMMREIQQENDVRFGRKISCDNCERTQKFWTGAGNISLVSPHDLLNMGWVARPDGKWFCPECRGESSSIRASTASESATAPPADNYDPEFIRRDEILAWLGAQDRIHRERLLYTKEDQDYRSGIIRGFSEVEMYIELRKDGGSRARIQG